MKMFKGKIELKGEYKLEVRKNYFSIFDKNNNEIYYENIEHYWFKKEYDKNNNQIYYENSKHYWFKREYDKNNNQIYSENCKGFWEKREYDKNNNLIYYEDSTRYIKNDRPKKVLEVTMQDLEEKYGCKVKVVK